MVGKSLCFRLANKVQALLFPRHAVTERTLRVIALPSTAWRSSALLYPGKDQTVRVSGRGAFVSDLQWFMPSLSLCAFVRGGRSQRGRRGRCARPGVAVALAEEAETVADLEETAVDAGAALAKYEGPAAASLLFAPRRDAFEGEAHTFHGYVLLLLYVMISNLTPFRQGSATPRPDTNVANIENTVVDSHQSKDQALAKKMSGMKVADSSAVFLMPRWLAYGTKGKQIIVWVNYFRIITPMVLYWYNLETRKGESTEEAADDPKGKRKGKAQGGDRGAGSSNELLTSVLKRKLKIILQHALAELQRLGAKAVLAPEFRPQLVSLNKLKLTKNPIVVELKNSSATCEEL